ncbi:head-tail connector protein, partial [Massilia eurypsychrophila]
NGSELDSELSIMVATLTAEAEHNTGRVIIKRTYRITLDEFPAYIEMPAWPVAEVIEVNYVGADGSPATLPSGTYRLDYSKNPIRLVLVPGATWPETSGIDAVKVDVICGHGADESATPPAFKGYVLAKIREAYTPGAVESPFVSGLLNSLRVY